MRTKWNAGWFRLPSYVPIYSKWYHKNPFIVVVFHFNAFYTWRDALAGRWKSSVGNLLFLPRCEGGLESPTKGFEIAWHTLRPSPWEAEVNCYLGPKPKNKNRKKKQRKITPNEIVASSDASWNWRDTHRLFRRVQTRFLLWEKQFAKLLLMK